ncbi:hypothetical protein PSQ19_17525 [Devosia algicola]|uniref:Uncharacterized protein n=1 Tax=Devosia algicola TaxID=3026418 RepID=A0ABY7YMD8_9HYPH|nr:hypothetical protein [Devosia algicola]WDR02389.1 hypothetical protein PSQ19_17525 [Devosia algicola]
MSSNNNDTSTAGAGLAIIVAGFAFFALFLFAVAAFITFVLSLLCVVACFKPLRIGKWELTTEEASWFLLRGTIGMWLVPAFIYFCDVAFSLGVVWSYLPHMFLFGYVAGSLGWEVLTADSKAEQAEAEVLPPAQQITHQASRSQVSPWQSQEPETFGYASWDDEEEFRK